MTSGKEIVEYARTLVGTPFHPGVHADGVAVDCFGVLGMIASHFGFLGVDRSIDGQPDRYAESLAVLDEHYDEVHVPSPGDFIVVGVGRSRTTPGRAHYGLFTDGEVHEPKGIIHATRALKRVAEDKFNLRWLDHAHRFYRFRGVKNG